MQHLNILPLTKHVSSFQFYDNTEFFVSHFRLLFLDLISPTVNDYHSYRINTSLTFDGAVLIIAEAFW